MLLLTVARLTLREASRRRLVLAFLVLTAVAIAVTGWGFQQLANFRAGGGLISALQIQAIASELVILVVFMFSFVLGLGAVFVAAPALAGDIESGIALAILARPISRSEVLLGKWLGVAIPVALYAIGSSAAELAVVRLTVGYTPPHPVEAVAYLIGEALVLLSFTLLLSVRLSAMTAGIAAMILFGLAWIAGVIGGIGTAFGDANIAALGDVSRFVLPTDGLWRGALYQLEPGFMLAGALQGGQALAAFPFFVPSGPAPLYLAWCVAWIATVLGLAIVVFERREI